MSMSNEKYDQNIPDDFIDEPKSAEISKIIREITIERLPALYN